jgi:dienelactone hydrolase
LLGEGLLLSLAKIAAAVAIGLPLVVYLAQDSLIFYRQPLADARRADIQRRFPAASEVTIPSADGAKLHGWLVMPQGTEPVPLVLYFGGNAEEVSFMLESVGDPVRGSTPGAAWLLMNYRGYGASEGSPSQSSLVADALAHYDFAARRAGVDPQRIFVFGRSLGSGVAVQLAAQRPVHGVILVAPYDSLAAVAKRYYWYLPVDWMLKHRFDSIALAPQMKQPLLCLIAEHDEVIPAEHSERLFAAWAGPKRKVLLGAAGHNNTDGVSSFWPAVRELLKGVHG